MLPPLDIIRAGLARTTAALAAELAQPGTLTPAWNAVEWRLATAAAAVHGVAALLARDCRWQNPSWQTFLGEQRAHVADRHGRLTALLARIDAEAQAGGLALLALKGSALHALGLYAAGERPMADIDLLVAENDVPRAVELLRKLGYVETYAQWKHRVFKPANEAAPAGLILGEHRATPITIELHTRIAERLPVAAVDITAHVYPRQTEPGLNPYPSRGALMSHLLLHAAGNVCNRNLRLMQLHDIALLAARMTDEDWRLALHPNAQTAWWALPPLCLTARYYPGAIPAAQIAQIESACPLWLRTLAHRHTLIDVSLSRLWLQPFPGIEWSRSPIDAARHVARRLRPTQESRRERADMIRTQTWLQGQSWVSAPQHRRWLTWLVRPVPRTDTLYAVRAAFETPALAA